MKNLFKKLFDNSERTKAQKALKELQETPLLAYYSSGKPVHPHCSCVNKCKECGGDWEKSTLTAIMPNYPKPITQNKENVFEVL